MGGLHLLTGVNPDIAMFGKALGNGYAITAVIGKGKVMNKAKKSFISSTFWSERIGFSAGIATISYMIKNKTWEKLINSGKYLNSKWRELSSKYELPIEISGIESITQFRFDNKNNHYLKNFLTQEMLKKNILATNLVFLNIFHTKSIIDKYIRELDKIFLKIKNIQSKKQKIFSFRKKSLTSFTRMTD